MKICWFWFELKLLLVDIAFSARLSEETTRVSQHFGVLTIGFSSCAFVEELVARAVDRYDDVSVTHSLLLVDRSREDKRSDDRYRRDDKKEDRYKREDKAEERAIERSKERSKDRRMRTRSDKRPSRKHDRKVLVAEESTKSWEDTDSESSSSSSSSSDSEQEEVHCLMCED
ncbi:hypothetical protein F511_24422 [Dorcoceras hygrometricum]|uniref:Uncharacterized protein n=1 Tax=Dorcoceras hygrometricum TaxID=472368 RepID=A0A2Z7BEC9_9LAMI|nr:hypothetical protein F511_24422 [Dorcoceras hygrometricum]